MSTPTLYELAQVENGQQEFEVALGSHTQAAVTAGIETIATERDALKVSVANLEGNSGKLLDELKPMQAALKTAGIAVTVGTPLTPEALADLATRLEGKTVKEEPSEAAMTLARKLAGPMAEAASKPLTEEIATLTSERDAHAEASKASAARSDRSHLDLLVALATTGEDDKGKARPRLVPAFAQHFTDTVIAPFVHFEDQEDGRGGTRRVAVVRHGEVPIMDGTKQADVSGLVAHAFDGKADQPWNTGTRDFFISHGTGTGAERNNRDSTIRIPQAAAIAGAKTVEEVEKAYEG